MLEVATWFLTVVLMLVGFLGVIVPLLPGTTLILIAAVVSQADPCRTICRGRRWCGSVYSGCCR